MSATQTCERLGWTLQRVASTGSTNADLVGRSEDGLVLVADEQTAGRGRRDRTWVSSPGDGLTFSVRLAVPTTIVDWGWISLLAGLAAADAVRASGARDIAVKWPNDVVGGSGKIAGILSARDGDAVVIGIGINLSFAGERPDPNAVSVAEQGGDPDGDLILSRLLETLHGWWQRFVDSGGDAERSGLAQAYVEQCISVGAEVQVSEPDRAWHGHAEGIDTDGRLLVRAGEQLHALSAADVTLRG